MQYVETAAGSQQGRHGCLINGLQTVGSGPLSLFILWGHDGHLSHYQQAVTKQFCTQEQWGSATADIYVYNSSLTTADSDELEHSIYV